MKPGALLVNVARGPLVVTADLVAALEGKRLAGAVMDVTDPEPLPLDSRLWDLPGVIITPHVGGQSSLAERQHDGAFLPQPERRRAGLPLVNYLVDKRLGFPDSRRRLSALGRAVRAVEYPHTPSAERIMVGLRSARPTLRRRSAGSRPRQGIGDDDLVFWQCLPEFCQTGVGDVETAQVKFLELG